MDIDYKIFILYRPNNFYTDVSDFKNKLHLEDHTPLIYNLTKDPIHGAITTDEPVDIIIRSIYSENIAVNIVILDTTIKYINFNINALLTDECGYCLLNYNNFTIPIISNKLVSIENNNIILNYKFSNSSKIVCKGEIDSFFYNNLFRKPNTGALIFSKILERDIEDISQYHNTDLTSKPYHDFFKLYYSNDVNDESIIRVIKNKRCNLLLIEGIINDFLKQSNFDEKRIVKMIIANFSKYKQNTLLINDLQHSVSDIYNYLISVIIKDPLFLYSDLPHWLDLGDNKKLLKYYPKIDKEMISVKTPFDLGDNISFTEKGSFVIHDQEGLLHNKSVIIHKDNILFLVSVNPLNYVKINSDKVVISYETNIPYTEYTIIGKSVNYNNFTLTLIKLTNDSYKFILLDSKTLNMLKLSNSFAIEDGYTITTLFMENDSLYFLTQKDEKLFRCNIDYKELFINVAKDLNNKASPFSLIFNTKKTIGVKIKGFNLPVKYTYNNYDFYNIPTKHKYFIDVSYDPGNKLININNKLDYIKNFIFFKYPDNSVEKKADLFFHNSTKKTGFYTKSIELQVSTTKDFREAKYYIIDQDVFERLSCLELSKIISNPRAFPIV